MVCTDRYWRISLVNLVSLLPLKSLLETGMDCSSMTLNTVCMCTVVPASLVMLVFHNLFLCILYVTQVLYVTVSSSC